MKYLSMLRCPWASLLDRAHRNVLHAKVLYVFASLFAATLCAGAASADTADEAATSRALSIVDRPAGPRIVLVLSGGGARGAAHIGVLKAIEAQRIPIAAVVGTSMGAIIGGLWAAGHSPQQIEQIYRSIDWPNFFIDDPDRSVFRFRRKREDADYLVRAAAGVGLDGIKLPSGAVHGQKVMSLLKRLTMHTIALDSFDNLPIPFRAVATDIVNAEAVVMADGSLADAMYASMAIPALIAPTRVNGRLLVDGAVSNNLPVDVALSLGADVIIAVDIASPLLPEEAFDSVLAVTDQLTTVLTRRTTADQVKLLRPQDILIRPQLIDISATGFDRAADAIPIAEQAVIEAHDRLSPFVVPEAEHARWRSAARRVPPTKIDIVDIEVETDSRVRANVLAHQAGIEPGAKDFDEIDAAVNRLYGTELFSVVSYAIHDGVLVLQPQRKSWGPNYLQLGLNLEDDFEGRNAYNLGVAFTATELNSLGGEWRTEASIGDRPLFSNELHQPFGNDGRWFIEPQLRYDGFNLGLYDDGGGLQVEYRIRRWTAALELGREIGTTSEVRLGVRSGPGTVDRLVGVPTFETPDADTGLAFVSFAYDDLDNLHFPRKGVAFDLEWLVADPSLGADTNYRALLANAVAAATYGEHTLFGSGNVAHVTDGEAPLHETFTLGGFLNLSGLRVNQLLGDQRLLFVGGYRYRWLSSPVLPAYLGASIEAGNVWDDEEQVDLDDLRLAGSVFVGFDTFLGPMYVAAGLTEDGDKTAYVYLGRSL